jgi:hypothetical protein
MHLTKKIIFFRRVTLPHKTLRAYYCINKTMKTHNIGESSCVLLMVSIMHGERVDQRQPPSYIDKSINGKEHKNDLNPIPSPLDSFKNSLKFLSCVNL